MMVAQLELRAKRLDAAEQSLAASLQLQPRLRPAVLGVQKELRLWRKHGANSPASVGAWPGAKDPWFLAKLCGAGLAGVDVGEQVARALGVST